MSKSRPALDPPKLRSLTWGRAVNIDASTNMEAATVRSWSDSILPLAASDSGAIVTVSAPGTDGASGVRVFTLPTVQRGLYFKFVWTTSDTNNSGGGPSRAPPEQN